MIALRLAVIGAGAMAYRRTRALLATGAVELCGVVSRRADRARAFGAEFGCSQAFDDVRRLMEDSRPDVALVAVPHAAQDEIVAWALGAGLHVLVGGPLSRSVAHAERIREAARAGARVVEAGYEARYKACWEATRALVREGAVGQLIAVRSTALWGADPESWYYDEAVSGGMPLTHMTYTFINPLRWLLGDPTHVSAFANRVKHVGPKHVREETCVANLLFPGGVLGAMMAGFVRPDHRASNAALDGAPDGTPQADSSWSITLLGTDGVLDLFPTEMAGGHLRLSRPDGVVVQDFASARDAFDVQAEAFVASIHGEDRCRNLPDQAIGDIRVAEAIVASAREFSTLSLAPLAQV